MALGGAAMTLGTALAGSVLPGAGDGGGRSSRRRRRSTSRPARPPPTSSGRSTRGRVFAPADCTRCGSAWARCSLAARQGLRRVAVCPIRRTVRAPWFVDVAPGGALRAGPGRSAGDRRVGDAPPAAQLRRGRWRWRCIRTGGRRGRGSTRARQHDTARGAWPARDPGPIRRVRSSGRSSARRHSAAGRCVNS